MAGPLSNIRVLDLTGVILGAYATMLLGDMGAEVIKVEVPSMDGHIGGDLMRWGGDNPAGAESGYGPLFMSFNRNKKSVTINLKSPEGKAILKQLIATSDVFACNRQQDTLARLGLSYEDVKAIKPDIIYVNAPGFGTGGCYEGFPAYDDLIQASSGVAETLPRTDGNPALRYLPTLAADKSVGLYMVIAINAALFARAQTGKGQAVEVPMMECFTHFTMSENLYGHQYVPPVGPLGYGRILNKDRRPYRTKDGWIAVTPYSDKNWIDFFAIVGRGEEFAQDERFNTYANRNRHVQLLYSMLEEITLQKTTEEWLPLLWDRNIPAMRVHTLESVMNDPHLKQRDFFHHTQHPEVGEIIALKHPIDYSETPADFCEAAPGLGEHNAEILAGLGYSAAQIEALKAQGAIG